MPVSRIDDLLREGPPSPEILPELEARLQEQLAKGTYDLNCNLAILTLYLLVPEETKVHVIEGILLKAMMAFPAPDFALCMYQIPEKYHQQLRQPINLAQQLEMAKFNAFWKDAEGVEILSQAVGWQSAVHSFIAGVVTSTYRSIRSKQLFDYLNVTEEELGPLLKENGWYWSKEDPNIVIVNASGFETTHAEVKPKTPDSLSLDVYQTLFTASCSQ